MSTSPRALEMLVLLEGLIADRGAVGRNATYILARVAPGANARLGRRAAARATPKRQLSRWC